MYVWGSKVMIWLVSITTHLYYQVSMLASFPRAEFLLLSMVRTLRTGSVSDLAQGCWPQSHHSSSSLLTVLRLSKMNKELVGSSVHTCPTLGKKAPCTSTLHPTPLLAFWAWVSLCNGLGYAGTCFVEQATRLALTSQRSARLYFLNAGAKGMCNHAQFPCTFLNMSHFKSRHEGEDVSKLFPSLQGTHHARSSAPFIWKLQTVQIQTSNRNAFLAAQLLWRHPTVYSQPKHCILGIEI